MAFTRIKQEKNVEIDTARAKLDEALRTVIERKNESPSSSDEDSNRDSVTDAIIKSEPEPSPAAPISRKPPSKNMRKRRRKDDGSIRNSNSYVMKLFDRAVDLSPFTEDTPLYPICRAWINNQPNQSSATNSDDEVKDEQPHLADILEEFDRNSNCASTRDAIYELPLPLSFAKDYDKDLRIPSPIPRPEGEEFVIRSDTTDAPSKEDLMKKNMERWRTVRQKWKKAAQTNEDRYRKSAKVLRSVFEKSQAQEDSDSQDLWDAVKSIT